jgi:hypothetical protein
MNLKESIKRILRESTTGDTPNDISQELINQPVTLYGDLYDKTKIHNVDVNPDGSLVLKLENGINVNLAQSRLRRLNVGINIPINLKVKKKTTLLESKTNSILHNLINMLFEGFDDIYYDWANYMCGMGECCDPYAIGFTLPKNHYDDYIFKLVDSVNYDDDGDYPKKLRDELPEVCYESPDLKNPDFDTIVFYGLYAEEIEDYMGPESNWRSDLLKIINKKFGCEAKQIIII